MPGEDADWPRSENKSSKPDPAGTISGDDSGLSAGLSPLPGGDGKSANKSSLADGGRAGRGGGATDGRLGGIVGKSILRLCGSA